MAVLRLAAVALLAGVLGVADRLEVQYAKEYRLSHSDTRLHLTAAPEKFATLKTPRLLGNTRFGFTVTFNAYFQPQTKNGNVGRHGGIFFGGSNPKYGRWTGHKTVAKGAKVSVVDWIDRRADHGFRIYGVRTAKTMNQYARGLKNPPHHWKLVFRAGKRCVFSLFGNGRLIARNVGCVSNRGYIGFYSYSGSALRVTNVSVRRRKKRASPLIVKKGMALAFRSHKSCSLKRVIYIPKTGREKFVTLSRPKLLGSRGFTVSFDVDFLKYNKRGVGRHGGVFFGSRNKKVGRWAGVKTIKGGAKVTVVDWIDRKQDRGMRMYGTNSRKAVVNYRRRGNAPRRWVLRFKRGAKCVFSMWVDGRLLFRNRGCVSNRGKIGFYSYGSSDIQISNLRVK